MSKNKNKLHSVSTKYITIQFQDDHQDQPLNKGDHCFIFTDDKRHKPYLQSAIIIDVDKNNKKYKVRTINTNIDESYHWHQIVQQYNKQIHSIDLQQHNNKILQARNAQNQPNQPKIPTITHKSGKRAKKSKRNNKRSRKIIESDSDWTQNDNEYQPSNKKRKLNNNSIDKMSHNTTNDNDPSSQLTTDILCIAQPYFPIVEYLLFCSLFVLISWHWNLLKISLVITSPCYNFPDLGIY